MLSIYHAGALVLIFSDLRKDSGSLSAAHDEDLCVQPHVHESRPVATHAGARVSLQLLELLEAGAVDDSRNHLANIEVFGQSRPNDAVESCSLSCYRNGWSKAGSSS